MTNKPNRLLLIRHGDDPPDDRVHTWAHRNGFYCDIRRPFDGDELGEPDETLAGTVIYGGKYVVFETDDHPFLNEEYRWIGACLDAGVPMLGICQGAQMIAWHLGAWAGAPKALHHEFGYYKIEPAEGAQDFLPSSLHVAQAHFHTFDLPEGAERLAGNAAYPNQAVRFRDNVYGFQFHAEQTIEGFRRWQDADWAPYGTPGVQSREEQNRLMAQHDAAQAEWFHGFLDGLFGRG